MSAMACEYPVICIVGPTASGKSNLAVRVATNLDAEVISADSMQIYRGMDIGTGKIVKSERLVPHHGLDIADPGEPFSVALYQSYARACFDDIAARGKRAVLCGGTGFYVRAAIDDYDFPEGEQVRNEVRDCYNAIAKEKGPQPLWEMLCEVDPDSASVIPVNDVKRVVRAFELYHQGESYAEQRRKLSRIGQRYPAVFIGLAVSPDVLRSRIDARVDAMFAEGLVEEVEGLLAAGFREGITAPQAIGYKEVVAALDGAMTMQEAADRVKVATHRYAKRQRTWFRKDKRVNWIDATSADVDELLERTLEIVHDNSIRASF